jgi:hypothetical protein
MIFACARLFLVGLLASDEQKFVLLVRKPNLKAQGAVWTTEYLPLYQNPGNFNAGEAVSTFIYV